MITFKMKGDFPNTDKISKKLKHMKPTYENAIIVADKWVQKNFMNEGDPVGGWAPLAPATIAARRKGKKKSQSTKILQDNGDLRRNWSHIITNKYGKLRSDVLYGKYHQDGTSRIPQRRILPTAEELNIKELFVKHVRTSIKKG